MNVSVLAFLPRWTAGFAILVGLMTSTSHAGGLGVTPADQFKVPEGFRVTLLHEVAAKEQGSWVSLTVDPKGRLIACDQAGGLFRINVSGDKSIVEKLTIDLTGAQGLLCAFGSLYANVNERSAKSGLWRLTDTDGDDQYDKKEHLVPLNGGSEHGPHGIVLSPDGKRLFFVAGNNTDLPASIGHSLVPKVWSEDHLLGRMPDARGHNVDRLAPGGFILSLNPDGSDTELVTTGFRNPYDIAFNSDGELFAYDADMEWDVGSPWYRPTRINHAISGAEFGWRNGTGKWPAYYPDSFGAAVDIGPGSPTGIVFGYGARFPEKYQKALFICDWSYGNIHAVHLNEDGATYNGNYETFATAAPLPVTDLIIHPDGAMYVTIGGRGTQSGLYRIDYVGSEPHEAIALEATNNGARELRRQLESLHVSNPVVAPENAVAMALDNLGNEDRAIRFAARIALEHQSPALWKEKVLQGAESTPMARLHGLIALARTGEKSDQSASVDALLSVPFAQLDETGRITWLRAAGLIALRLGAFDENQAERLTQQIDGVFPTTSDAVNRELAMMLVYLQAPGSIDAIVGEMLASPSQENQIHYAMTLRGAKSGWTLSTRKAYFGWFNEMATARGGMSFGGFLDNIRKVAIETLDPEMKTQLAGLLEKPKTQDAQVTAPARPLVKKWTVEELVETVSTPTHQPSFENGKAMFGAAQCYKCHRMGVQGGILGPDLTSAGGKYNPHDMLVSIIEPSKVISDQYGATQFLTEDGKIVVGRVINMHGSNLSVLTNMLDPSSLQNVNRDSVIETAEAKTSMMPDGLLDTLTKEEIVDLVAYLRAGGNPSHSVYQKPL